MAVAGAGVAEALEAAGRELASWARDGERAALQRHRWALDSVLAAEPASARGVEAMALRGVALLVNAAPEDALLLGETARRARVLSPARTPAQAFAGPLLEVLLAEAAVVAGRPLEADALLQVLARSIGAAALPRAGERFLRAAAATLDGRIQEDSLEHRRAAAAYARALEPGHAVLARTEARRRVAALCAEALGVPAGGADESAAGAEGALVAPVVIWALLGRIRVARAGGAGEEEVRTRWLDAERLLDRYGAPAGLGLRRLAAAVRAVTPLVGADRALAFAADEPALVAAVAQSLAEDGDRLTAPALFAAAVEQARERDDPATLARVLASYVASNLPPPAAVDDHVDALLRHLAGSRGPATLADKAELEPSLAGALDRALARWRDERSPPARLRAGVLIDVLQRPGWTVVPTGRDLEEPELPRALLGSWLARDWLVRVARGLRRRRGTAFVLVESVGERTTFVCMTPRGRVPAVDSLPRGRLAAWEALAAAARDEVDFSLLGGAQESSPGFVEQCRAAFAELPAAVRRAIAAHRTLLVVADARGGVEAPPVELLHDGAGHLGITHVVSRLPSLRDAALLLEGEEPPPPARRAVVVAVGVAEGLAPLPHAAGEAERVRELLRGRGWHAPPIQERYVDRAFVVERLPHAGVLHIAAHGVASADGEALLLPDGARLTPADLHAAPGARAPVVYLSTCELGSTRYLGAGARRGLAQSFLELGAPAVVASLTPVDDAIAATLGTVFYEEAAAHPVGEALRRARARVAAGGVGAALWGTTVLHGDPAVRLFRRKPGRRPQRTLADRLLDAVGSVAPDGSELEALLSRAGAALEGDPDDARLRGAAELVLSRLVADGARPALREGELRFAVELADELGHAGAAGIARLRAARAELERGRDREARALLDSALPILDSLNAVDPGWRQVRREAYARWEALELAERGDGVIVLPSGSPPADAGGLSAEALAVASQAFAHRSGRARLSLPEESEEDIAWNAVVLGHPLRFEEAPPRARVGALTAAKLEAAGALPRASAPWARTLVTGLLSYLWSGLVTVDVSNVGVGARAVAAALADLRAWWSPPEATWLEDLAELGESVRASARRAAGASSDEEAAELEAMRRSLCERWLELAAGLRRSDPGALAGCTAFVLGTIVEAHEVSGEAGTARGLVPDHVEALLAAMHGLVREFAQLRSYASPPREEAALMLWRHADGVDDAAPPSLSHWL